MKLKITLVLSLFFAINYCLIAQNITEIQGFNYDSNTRDSLIEFPTGDHNQYEKILMYYSMRCKDGLISTGQDRNKGCGEWDYSCNTYLVDSSRVDSLLATAPTHRISGFSGTSFDYTTQPTFTYYKSVQKETNYTNVITETEGTIGNGDIDFTTLFGENQKNSRTQLLYKKTDLENEGLQAGAITGLKINVALPDSGFRNLRIRMKNSNDGNLDRDNFDENGLTEVYYLNTDMTDPNQFFKFHSPFNWNGTSNVLVDISYEKSGSPATSTVKATNQNTISSLSANGTTDYALDFYGSGKVNLDKPLPAISNEVTVSLWAFGNQIIPTNTTVFEAIDDGNRRQMNVHLPWENGRVYWDCGNNGSGYDRIDKAASEAELKNQWNHWAFVKNATSGEMKIYLNGTLWHSGINKFNPIDIQKLNVGAAAVSGSNLAYYGKIDEFRIWNKELSANDIKAWMGKTVTASHPNYDNLMVYYKFDIPASTMVIDESPNGNDGNIQGQTIHREWQGKNLTKNISKSMDLPNLTFVQGEYEMNIVEQEILLPVVNMPNKIDEYILDGSDLKLDNTEYYYQAGDMPVYDENFMQIDMINAPKEGTIVIGELNYTSKRPAKFELLSFVTPYGIGLDFGKEGKTWVFDVTDYGPILKGKKRLTMERGGQWQEDIDIKFAFIEGTPSRDVRSVTQVWPATAESNAVILSDTKFEPRDIPTSSQDKMFKMKAAITGHGQQGEFISRRHTVVVNDFDVKKWDVWTECADNPVYPQGGTWIYDRAGWCPGAPTDVQEKEIAYTIDPGEPAKFDYFMTTASGDSRYIVNVQFVTYGDPNFTLDAELLDIISPSTSAIHGRFNPMCGKPIVSIRNNGSTPLTALDINFDINGGSTYTYTWEGNLDYLETEEVELPRPAIDGLITDDAVFNVSISNPNGSTDAYENNNSKSSKFEVVRIMQSEVVIRIKTNNRGAETSYKVVDDTGKTIHERSGNLGSNKNYLDTLKNLDGCYLLLVEDTDDDGISFWANNDGEGVVQIKNTGATFFGNVATDFGRFVRFEFAIEGSTAVEDIAEEKSITVFPNPGDGLFRVQYYGLRGDISLALTNQVGQVLQQNTIKGLRGTIGIHELDLVNYPAGIYYLKIREGNSILVRKIIKF